MLKNYFKTTLRSVIRKKVFSLVNLAGLSTGLAACIVISAFIISETSFDNFHTDSQRTYRVIEQVEGGELGLRLNAQVPGAVGPEAKQNIAGVDEYLRIFELGVLNIRNGENEFGEPFYSVDPNFFSFFDYELILGDRSTVMNELMGVVLSESAAKKYFGDENPIGKSLEARTNNGDFTLVVSGLMKDMPENSHLHFDIVFPHSIPDQMFNDFLSSFNSNWGYSNFTTYLKLGTSANQAVVTDQLNRLTSANRPKSEDRLFAYSLQPLTDIHFKSELLEGDLNYRESSSDYVYIFSIVGLVLLTIALVNYINLSTIKATDRIREIGLRRVVGASRRQLILQFMTDSAFFSTFSLVLGFTLIQLIRPFLTSMFGVDIIIYLLHPTAIALIIGVVLILGLLAGYYPALIVLRSKMIASLKNQTIGMHRQTFFKGVTLIQFVVSITMVLSTIVVYSQLNYINNKNLGYEKESVALIEINSNLARRNRQQIINGFQSIPEVMQVSAVSRVPAEWKQYYEIELTNEAGVVVPKIPFMTVDENFLDLFNIGLVSGRNFRTDSRDSLKVLINETLAQQLGISQVEGQNLTLSGIKMGAQELGLARNPVYEVAGIVKDFHFQSLRERIPPMVMGFKRNVLQNIDYFTVKLQSANPSETMLQLKEVMKLYDPSPFDYNFLDDKVARYYEEDAKRSSLFIAMSSIAVFIAFIGLFALVNAAIQRRVKELGIRKVLGAGSKSLALLLSSEYAVLLALAMIIASPIGYWGISQWLNDFVYKTEIHWWFFGFALVICLIITALASFTQIYKAVSKNPSEVLRTEN
ncbi:hypothetical protein BFP97_05200 [Roseivirga sp. 4D4]|uniref:ABC transporter permease n=1 Tax=Roseivirga sp. 4D4 TaxID=1889784 RepID=UPI000853B68B|nr:FtsX-like permease family protein [Roseivirga sp. 4D4]OEK00940.1 hypothetical protein BFP97_05200 [Roseivirga sp. 4D4]